MRDDLYGVLGLEPRATSDQLQRAYRFCLELYAEGSLATYSLLDPSEAEAQRQRVKEAYEVLADAEKRRAYDENHGFQPPAPASVVPFPTPASRQGAGEGALEISGPGLRRVREARGLSLRHIASVTRIGMRFLEYIEEDRHAFLPAPVYLRGFLTEYARLVGLDPRQVVEAYMARIKPKS
jgi:flagellar biosynthesis protein FlhG